MGVRLPGLPGGLSAFDEALYGKAAHDPDVYAAIVKVTEAAENGEVDAKALAELEKRTGDATFAAALMNAMGAARFRKLMGKTVGHEDDKKVERLQIALGKTLGTASPKLSNAWRDELTSDLAIGWQEGYAISLALKYGTSKYAVPNLAPSNGVSTPPSCWRSPRRSTLGTVKRPSSPSAPTQASRWLSWRRSAVIPQRPRTSSRATPPR